MFQEWKQKRRVSITPSLEKRNSSDSLMSGDISQRRRSTLKGVAHGISGILGLRRLTIAKSREDQQKPRLANTYKLSPDEGMASCSSKVRQIAEEILESELSDMTYDREICGKMACDLAAKIKAKVKELGIPRYKIVCQVIIGQVQEQGIEAASRCVWDSKTDTYECISYKNRSVFAVAMIHGVYFE